MLYLKKSSNNFYDEQAKLYPFFKRQQYYPFKRYWFICINFFRPKDKIEDFKEITVERINVVNVDSTIVMAISNKQRIANPVMGGKKYRISTSEGREYMAGIIFLKSLAMRWVGWFLIALKCQTEKLPISDIYLLTGLMIIRSSDLSTMKI